jgi:hypothetical protein
MTSRIGMARAQLHEALAAALEPTPWRAHQYPPSNIAAPCVYIGTYASDAVEPRIVISFPVVVVVDGTDWRQVEQLDDIGAIVSDAIFRAGGIPRRTLPFRLDVGGPTLRASETTAELTLSTMTMCLPVLQEATS